MEASSGKGPSERGSLFKIPPRVRILTPRKSIPAVRKSPSSGAGDRVEAWQALTAEIEACRRCPLGFSRTHAVPYRGSLTPRIVFLGEAPGRDEDRVGRPFVGRAGRLLDATISAAGIPEDRVGFLNLLKCRPPNNRFDGAAAASCRPFLDRQLTFLAPRALVTLGSHALRAVAPDRLPISTAMGRASEAIGLPLLPLLHPAATFRRRAWAEAWRDGERSLAAFARELGDAETV